MIAHLVMAMFKAIFGSDTQSAPAKPPVLGGYYGPGQKVETPLTGTTSPMGLTVNRMVEPRGIQYEGRVPGKTSTVYDPSKPPTLGGTPSTGTGIKRFR